MNKIINLETTLKCVYGIVDEEGNVISKHPVTLEIPKHNIELFSNALEILQNTKKEIVDQLNKNDNVKL